jgi:hypothetical protein
MMSCFTKRDFYECLQKVNLPAPVNYVQQAWGCEGNWKEWQGGFIVLLKDGKYSYISSWCSESGWGYQEKVSVAVGDIGIALEAAEQDRKIGVSWVLHPKDLNKWIKDGMMKDDL